MFSKAKPFLFSLSLLLGIYSGIIFLQYIPLLPLQRNHPLYKIFGIKKPTVVGFLPYWLLEKAQKNYTNSITTLTYFGLTLDTDGRILQLISPREEEPGWHTLRSENLHQRLKMAYENGLTLSLLVHNSDEASISALLDNPVENAQHLISDLAPIMQKYKFTDLNLDIESFVESSPSAQQAFTQFVAEVKLGMLAQKLGSLTVEISPTALVKNFLINPTEIGKIADYVVLMAYDYHYSGSYNSGPVAPLGGVPQTREFDVNTGLSEAVKVIPQEKIILGIPLYGYEWETLSNLPNAPAIPGSASTASNHRVEKLISDCKNCQINFADITKSPRILFPDESGTFFHQIYYENETSFQQKLQLAQTHNISGVALWALGYEGEKNLEALIDYKQATL